MSIKKLLLQVQGLNVHFKGSVHVKVEQNYIVQFFVGFKTPFNTDFTKLSVVLSV
jgi:hypothetical protein